MCSHPSTRDFDICRICRLDLKYSDQKTDLCPFDIMPSDHSELTKYKIFLSMTHNLCFLHTLKLAQTATDVDIDALAVFLPYRFIEQTVIIQCGVCKGKSMHRRCTVVSQNDAEKQLKFFSRKHIEIETSS